MENVQDIRSYGAAESVLATDYIQRAVDAAWEQGGGTVVVPPGRWLTGTLRLRSHVTLHLCSGALLEASEAPADFDSTIPSAVEAPTHTQVLLYAENAEDIGISGTGVIDEKSLWFPEFRPMLLRFVGCSNVNIQDVTLKNAGAWCAHLIDCEDVLLDHVTIRSTKNPNNDGFDLDGCRRVMIRGCTIDAGDDAVCLKSTLETPCEDIFVQNCILSSTTAAVKLGTSSRSGFRNVVISDCVFRHCRMGAIKLLLVDGGILEQVLIHDIVMDDVEGPFFVRLGDRGKEYDRAEIMNYAEPTAEEQKHDRKPGILRDVTMRDCFIRIRTDAPDKNCMMITGIPGAQVERLTLDNLDIELPGGWTESVPAEPAEDAARYPEQWFFGVLPASVCFMRHAKNVTLKNLRIRRTRPDTRPPFFFKDVKELTAKNVTVDGELVEMNECP